MTTNERIQRDRQLRADALKRHEAQHGFIKGFWLATKAMARDINTIILTSLTLWACDRLLRVPKAKNARRETPSTVPVE